MIKDLDERTKQMMDFFETNYTPIKMLNLNVDKKIFLGDKDNKVCRFCGKKDGETSFRNESHAIPEFIGNKLLIANYECDACNSKFSRLLETHLSNYMHLSHTLSQVKGKNGVPTFKSNKKLSRIDVGTTAVEIKDFENDSIAKIDEAQKTLTITATQPSYIPIAVFKCFVKMALTIMPKEELSNFEKTLDWINEESHENGVYSFHDLKLLRAFYSGVHPFDFITLGLLKRKVSSNENVPFMVFFIAYSNYFFQIHLPLNQQDENLKEVRVTFFPAHAALGRSSNDIKVSIAEMKGKTFIRGKKQSITMQATSIAHTEINNVNDSNE